MENQLIPATLDELNKTMEKDVNLKMLLTMTGKELEESDNENIKKYSFILKELANNPEEQTLLNLIKASMMGLRLNITSLYTINKDNKLIGFLGYQVYNNCIEEIKAFSFNSDVFDEYLKNTLIIFLNENISIYEKIIWYALKENPSCKIYDEIINDFNGERKEWKKNKPNEPEIWEYIIKGKSKE